MAGLARLLGTAATMLLLGVAAPAQAQDATDALLLKLKEKGILTEEEYQALLVRKAAQPAPAVTAAPAAVPTTTAAAAAPDPQQAAAERLDDKTYVRTMASGVGIQIGDVSVKLSGSVNGFYVSDNGATPGPRTAVIGGLATVGEATSSIRNGLLPGFLKVDVTTNQGGWDIGAHFGLYPGINSVTGVGGANTPGNPQALATSGIDARQTYLTFGKPKFGEVKIGRDIGLFGSDAILNDITLLAVGTAAGNAAPSNTSLGRIGLGYIYTDFQPQITYTSPRFGGFQVSVGAFQPLINPGVDEFNDTPGFQGKLTWDRAAPDGGLGVHAWLSGIVQKHEPVGLPSYTARGVDFGAKFSYGPASLLGYYYTGTGIGTTGLFILSTDALGNRRDSDGFFVQGTYTLGKFTLGGSYGRSNLDLADGEVNPLLVESNSSWVGQLRYGLTGWLTLVTEYTNSRARAHGGNRATSDTLAAGAILFF